MKNILILGLMSMLMIGCLDRPQSDKTNVSENIKQDSVLIRNIIDDFFSTYKKEGIRPAFIELLSSNPHLIDQGESIVSNLSSRLQNDSLELGEFRGYETISEQSMGNVLKIYTCISKYELRPMRFVFIFYNCNDSWRLQEFTYDGDIIDELKEMAKFYYDIE